MNYVKAQQELLAYILSDAPRRVCFHHNKNEQMTLLVNPTGSLGYLIPDCVLALNLTKCTELNKFPFQPCPAEEQYRITSDGSTRPGVDGKGCLLVFETKQGAIQYIDKKLCDKFGKDTRFFQEKELGVVTAAEPHGNGAYIITGYICPCRPPKNKSTNQ